MARATRYSVWCGMVVAAALATTTMVRASDPIGVYAVVDRVEVTTTAGQPATAKIWGTFALAVAPPTRTYEPDEAYGKPRKGFLLFTCPAVRPDACHAEWNDLRSVAGKNEIVGFGTRWNPAPKVRVEGEAVAAPDVYSLNVGVVKLGKYGSYPGVTAALKALGTQK